MPELDSKQPPPAESDANQDRPGLVPSSMTLSEAAGTVKHALGSLAATIDARLATHDHRAYHTAQSWIVEADRAVRKVIAQLEIVEAEPAPVPAPAGEAEEEVA